LATKINQFQPDLIISLGLAGNRTLLCLEKQAINLIKCDIADNDGEKILDRVIRPEGAHFLKTSIDLDKLEKQLLNHYEFLQISDNAGTFVCNFLYYQLLKEYPQTPSLFIHIPMIASNSSEFEQYTEALLQLIAKIDSL
jgi:pyroglutamyl-peptidase